MLADEIYIACDALSDLSIIEEEEFLRSRHLIGSAKYHFIVAIEGTIDLAHHLISLNKWKFPVDYAGTYAVLAEQNLLDAGFAQRLSDMARFRNRLVHRYWNVDDGVVWQILQEDVSDILRFLESVLAFLSQEK